MKYFYFAFFFSCISFQSHGQVVFWTEAFQNNCASDCVVNTYVGLNGPWTVTNTGTNGTEGAVWYVSGAECGMADGECGEVCAALDPSLHVGTSPNLLGDLGASFLNEGGGFFEILANKRADSPAIDCSGYTSIEIDFNYIEGGEGTIDNATLWYYDGATWSLLADMPKTLFCGIQGLWDSFTVALPASANNNPNVKIGFNWTNNDNGLGDDPTFATDDITLSGITGTDTEAPEIACPSNLLEELLVANNCVAFIQDYTSLALVTDNVDPSVEVTQIPAAGAAFSGPTLITLTATDDAGNSAMCSFTIDVVDNEPPQVLCSDLITVTAPVGEVEMFVNVPALQVDDCSDVEVENDYNGTDNASDIYPIGISEISFLATDEFGNVSGCTVLVNVLENTNQDCCLGDFNCDGVVSVLDLIIIIGQFGCITDCTADLNEDGIVGTTDMNIFISLYGDICN